MVQYGKRLVKTLPFFCFVLFPLLPMKFYYFYNSVHRSPLHSPIRSDSLPQFLSLSRELGLPKSHSIADRPTSTPAAISATELVFLPSFSLQPQSSRFYSITHIWRLPASPLFRYVSPFVFIISFMFSQFGVNNSTCSLSPILIS